MRLNEGSLFCRLNGLALSSEARVGRSVGGDRGPSTTITVTRSMARVGAVFDHRQRAPGGWSAARRLLSRTVESKNTLPPFELWELFALAQHHGIPTRFLDWSRRPLVAAYFAAYGAAEMLNRKQSERPEHFGIWALNTTALWRAPSSSDAVHLVEPSRYGNRNLMAQDGIFTVHVYSWSPDEAPRCEPLDSTVERLQPKHGIAVGRAKMRLLSLPIRKARKLLGRLESENISASTLFPGYDGVVRSIVEKVTHSDSAWRSPARED